MSCTKLTGGGEGARGGVQKSYTRTDHFMLFCTKVDKRLFLGRALQLGVGQDRGLCAAAFGSYS